MDKKENNKEKILLAAEKLFSEKGYDAARIDEIASVAGVNEALIYYYFHGKHALLEELFDRFFRESAAMLVNYVQHGGLDSSPSSEADRIFEGYFSYFEAKRDLLRIMLMESLKAGEKSPPVFKLVDFEGLVDEKTAGDIRDSGMYSPDTMNLTLVAEFYTGVIPMLCYVLFQEHWCRYFDITPEQLRSYFNRAMELTHEAYHQAMRDHWSKEP